MSLFAQMIEAVSKGELTPEQIESGMIQVQSVVSQDAEDKPPIEVILNRVLEITSIEPTLIEPSE